MRTVFADAGYWIAVLDPKDSLHSLALKVSQNLGRVRIVTSEMVLAEVLATLSSPPLRVKAVEAIESLQSDPNTEVIPQTGLLFQEALQRYKSRPDKAWSLTDCASFMIMEQQGIQEALAYDEHFEQAGFVALLRQADK
jgi:predicted nucleic acid-binding protein